MSNKEKATKISWLTLAFMAFSTVWGFGNITNGFVYFNGPQVIFSWIFMFALYFIPYALMVGELALPLRTRAAASAPAAPDHQRQAGLLRRLDLLGLPHHLHCQQGQRLFESAELGNFPQRGDLRFLPHPLHPAGYLLHPAAGLLHCKSGSEPPEKAADCAGTCTFVMSLLYIVMMFAAPAINPTAEYVHANLSFSSMIPNFNVTYFTSLSILVFAVGGCEKISPYVNKVENPSKGFPRGMIALAVMVVTCAILGTLAMSRMFDPAVINASAESFNAYVANSSYWAFQKLGQYYHVGDLFMIIYALCNVISQLAVLILSIDAPLRMLLDNEHTKQFIPQALHKVNAHGVHSNGIKMVAVLSGSIILAQSFVPGAAAVLRQLTKLNSVCMPMRYLWVFAAYIALRNAYDTIPAEYRFVKNQAVAKFFGGWCFAVTAVCCVLGMYDKDPFTFALNVITPVVLTVLGLILPALAKREQTAAKK